MGGCKSTGARGGGGRLGGGGGRDGKLLLLLNRGGGVDGGGMCGGGGCVPTPGGAAPLELGMCDSWGLYGWWYCCCCCCCPLSGRIAPSNADTSIVPRTKVERGGAAGAGAGDVNGCDATVAAATCCACCACCARALVCARMCIAEAARATSASC